MYRQRKDYGCPLRVWDNGGKTADRYTIMPPSTARSYRHWNGLWHALSANKYPFDPQGIGQSTTALPGNHLGKRVHWSTLPKDVQRFAERSFPEFF